MARDCQRHDCGCRCCGSEHDCRLGIEATTRKHGVMTERKIGARCAARPCFTLCVWLWLELLAVSMKSRVRRDRPSILRAQWLMAMVTDRCP